MARREPIRSSAATVQERAAELCGCGTGARSAYWSRGNKYMCVNRLHAITGLAFALHSYTPMTPMNPAILIIDDDPGVRVMLTRLVGREGYAAIAAASGSEGYTRLVECADSIALIFLDLRMPDMNGFAFRELQLKSPATAAIPTVVMTGQTVSGSEIERLHPAAWLPKPARVAIFLEMISTHARLPPALRADTESNVG
jgi:CheY-like chemotaxis protein